MVNNKFCMECGTQLDRKMDEHLTLLYCPTCRRQVYQDPKVATCTLIANEDGEVLLAMRALEPGLGKWALPGGYINRGEIVEEAAIREVREETGLTCEITELIGVYSLKDIPPILIVYRGQIKSGKITPSSETPEVEFFFHANLPPLSFPRDENIIGKAFLPA